MAYSAKHGKVYSTKTEWKSRKAAWSKTDAAIKAHNADPTTFSGCTHNFMSDYTQTELKNMKGYDGSLSTTTTNVATYDASAPTASAIDWYSLGKVTPIQN